MLYVFYITTTPYLLCNNNTDTYKCILCTITLAIDSCKSEKKLQPLILWTLNFGFLYSNDLTVNNFM